MADTIRNAVDFVVEYAQLHCLVQNTICMNSYYIALELKKVSKKMKSLEVELHVL